MRGLILLLIFCGIANSAKNAEGQCIWFGKCGKDPKFNDNRHILNCLYRGAPKIAKTQDVQKLKAICPHLIEEFGENELNLCCDSEQIEDLVENMALPSAVLERCPTCLANFRKNFCDLTCRPDQSKFANASKIVKAPGFDGKNMKLFFMFYEISLILSKTLSLFTKFHWFFLKFNWFFMKFNWFSMKFNLFFMKCNWFPSIGLNRWKRILKSNRQIAYCLNRIAKLNP